ncbi:amidase [Nonomuraea sp. PA05]|uniref:amidase n=1 Tax=Nonomuraea sp. PA05 TaxID=2604466 RepID=UPI0011D4DA14|nr:amidase [Nonomuraea sp. PA05]TYB57607.1 amidase [Nonomuraea sp. PA05]
MRAQPPTPADLAAISARYGFGLTGEDLAAYHELTTETFESYAAVERQAAAHEQPAPGRDPGHRPHDDPLGAWQRRASIKGAPTGPLAGRTVAVKDNVCVAGVPMSGGSAALEGFVPARDATVVTRLLDAGAEITGTSVCEDLCLSGGSHTSATGPVRNPHDLTRSAGGSSSGSAALLAAGEVDLAIGGDQGGSVRIPAAWCGVVGLKPTFGLVPCTGSVPIEPSVDHLGPMARTVAGVADLLSVIAGPDGRDPRQDPRTPVPDYRLALDGDAGELRVGLLAEGFGLPGRSDPAVDATVRALARRLDADVRDVSVPEHRDAPHVWTVIVVAGATTQLIDLAGGGVAGCEPGLAAALHRGRREHAGRLSATVKLVTLLGAHLIHTGGGAHYAMARQLAVRLTAAYDAALAEVDVLALPTLPMTATRLPAPGAPPREQVARALEMIPNTCPFDVTGHPAISVPAGLSGGLPVGLMLVGRHGDEVTLLRAAAACERLSGGCPAITTTGGPR